MLRKRKNRRYNETNDEEGDGDRKFDILEQVKSERFDQIKDKHLKVLPGEEITLRLIQRDGFEKPILVQSPEGLALRVPPKTFLVRDVRNCVGQQRIIDVMDVKTQKNIEMSMKDWCKYYESKNRDRLLNVISLEFSHTKLDEMVDSPMIVKLLDWVDLVWPKFLKESQTESTNTITKMKYPKVQKYCLMSVKGSYTDFHIDFGGTSVWYHILRGKKIFWMVPPTELNLQIFEEWTLSGMQQNVFFGDTVEECFRVELSAGNTFFIPSGWIHAVYTLEDSLVFGGNFLHSFGIENQLKVSKIEDATKVPVKFRYPFYTEILWYVVQHYVYCLMNKDHLHKHEVMKAVESNKIAPEPTPVEIEDESTETEIDECEAKSKKSPSRLNKKKNVSTKSTKNSTKKPKRAPTPSSTDDDSTEIESSEDEPIVKKQPVATCRMTKNSLLRLQYEVEQSPIKPATSPAKANDVQLEQKTKKVKTETDTCANTNNNAVSTINLSDFALSNDSKPNGWLNRNISSEGPQPHVWSNPTSAPEEIKKVHITRYELNGLRALVAHLSKLSKAKKNLPVLIRNSRALLDDCKKLINEHENDDPELAVTGKPITPELLNVQKRADINELIGQFFKTNNSTEMDVSSPMKQTACNQARSRTDSLHRSRKLSSSADNINGSESVESECQKSGELDSTETKTTQRETKCLSPSKKLQSSFTTANVPSSSQPQRPKSPPTRPISINQYSSKTKSQQSNINVLLPGSFADLIAATSTEKKVFDVTGDNSITSSLFGGKDLPTNKSSTAQAPGTSQARDKDRALKSESSKLSPLRHVSSPADPLTSAGAGGSAKESQRQYITNSSDPTKSSPQKRFIIPNQNKPASKEKLIFASAPYVSPINSLDQSRSANPYPWQTPAHSAPQQQQHNLPHLPTLSNQSLSAPKMSNISPPAPKVTTSTSQDSHSTHQSEASISTKIQTRDFDSPLNQDISHHLREQPKQVPKETNPISNFSVIQMPLQLEQEPKKPTKPRGPPKKSKEARLVLETEPDTKPPVHFSVIKAGPSTSQGPAIETILKVPKSKAKTKRSKKQKDEIATGPPIAHSVVKAPLPQTPIICGLVTSPTNTPPASHSHAKIASQPYLITRPLMFNPLTSLSAAQYQQMQRASSMPLFTSPMIGGPPSMSASPFQQGARIVWATQPRPITPVSQSNGSQNSSNMRCQSSSVPSSATTSTSNNPNKSQTSLLNSAVNTSTHSDNAALLSLATTALSTASMNPTPTLSHLSHLMPSNHAIVVSSANSNPHALFAGQQYLRPAFLPGMPMAHFVGHPGMTRPPTTGQLVFARLPNQPNPPRYLITPPGFMQQRIPTPHIVTSQPASTLAYAAFKPPADSSKELKSKKVKTS